MTHLQKAAIINSRNIDWLLSFRR